MKKKVVFVVYHLVCGGVESALFDLIGLMDKREFDVTVFSIYGGGQWESKFKAAGINVLTCTSRIVHHKNPLLRLRNSINARRVNHALAHGGKGLLKSATGENFDIIVAYHIGSEFHDVCFVPGAKAVKYVHGSINSNALLLEDIKKYVSKLVRFDKVVCVSKNVQKELLELVPLTNTCVCYNPINAVALNRKAKENAGMELPDKYICTVGRLVHIKGFTRLVSCFWHVLQTNPGIKLVIVGEGDERFSIEKEIRSLGMEDHVILAGYQNNPYPYIQHALFYVCSSFSEGMPVTVMEALCLGVPVVSSYKAAEELFADLPCGIATDSDDESLTSAMMKMLQTHRLQEARCAAQKRKERFESNDMVTTVQMMLKEL